MRFAQDEEDLHKQLVITLLENNSDAQLEELLGIVRRLIGSIVVIQDTALHVYLSRTALYREAFVSKL